MALTPIMKEAMDCIQRNKQNVGITNKLLFVRSDNMEINPRESIRKVIKNLKLKKPSELTGNGLRHHAATFSKLHSSHPQYQDYLASALGHTLHIHKMHYEMPTSILQKLIVMPVLENLTKPVNERNNENDSQVENTPNKELQGSPAWEEMDGPSPDAKKSEIDYVKNHPRRGKAWSDEEKSAVYKAFGKEILIGEPPNRLQIMEFRDENLPLLSNRPLNTLVTFINNNAHRKQKNVTPEVKKYVTKHT